MKSPQLACDRVRAELTASKDALAVRRGRKKKKVQQIRDVEMNPTNASFADYKRDKRNY